MCTLVAWKNKYWRDTFALLILFLLAWLSAGALVRDDVFILGDFGVPLEEISDTQVYAYCRRFNLTTIVATINDFRARLLYAPVPRFL